jgi:sulfoxide reductase heme-binding subunit YedZ
MRRAAFTSPAAGAVEAGLTVYLAALPNATTGPSWYWYATRGLGISTLIVLTITVVLGIVTSVRWSGEATPGFVAADVHRNLSLLAIFMLVMHIATTVLDPYAHITARDAFVPVGAAYRPVWLGLGVAAAEILIAVAASSILRGSIGHRPWRLIHWTAYTSWPLAVVHGLGTGSDARAAWMIAVVAWCMAAVLIALAYRLRRGPLATLPIRAAAVAGIGLFIATGSSWAFSGPLAPGWAARAGTPTVAVSTKHGPVHPGPNGFSDPLVGVMARDASGYTQISMRDAVDTTLTVAIRSPNANESLPVITIARDGRVLCTVPATAADILYAVCGATRLTISLNAPTTGQITGQLVTSGALN